MRKNATYRGARRQALKEQGKIGRDHEAERQLKITRKIEDHELIKAMAKDD